MMSNMTMHSESLAQITDELLSDQIDYSKLLKSLEAYRNLLEDISQVSLKDDINRENIQLENGTAIGTTWAALCINDLLRTWQFVRGIFCAVQDIRVSKSNPIRILYAGSGPFATLVLPLTTKYSYEDLQITLLEINQGSVKYLKRVIAHLGIEKYIEEVHCVDATKYEIPEDQDFDILICETMQHALVKEQQVPIMFNLLSQLKDDICIIPEKIRLDVALMNPSTDLILEGRNHEKYKVLTTLLEFDQSFIRSYLKENKEWNKEHKIELIKQLSLPNDYSSVFQQLVILTQIQVYKDEWIKHDASPLTLPKVLFDLSQIPEAKQEISISYHMNGNPRYEFGLRKSSNQ